MGFPVGFPGAAHIHNIPESLTSTERPCMSGVLSGIFWSEYGFDILPDQPSLLRY